MPQDGVYLNGTLSYHEGSLLFKADVGEKAHKSTESSVSPYYIANVEEYVASSLLCTETWRKYNTTSYRSCEISDESKGSSTCIKPRLHKNRGNVSNFKGVTGFL